MPKGKFLGQYDNLVIHYDAYELLDLMKRTKHSYYVAGKTRMAEHPDWICIGINYSTSYNFQILKESIYKIYNNNRISNGLYVNFGDCIDYMKLKFMTKTSADLDKEHFEAYVEFELKIIEFAEAHGLKFAPAPEGESIFDPRNPNKNPLFLPEK